MNGQRFRLAIRCISHIMSSIKCNTEWVDDTNY